MGLQVIFLSIFINFGWWNPQLIQNAESWPFLPFYNCATVFDQNFFITHVIKTLLDRYTFSNIKAKLYDTSLHLSTKPKALMIVYLNRNTIRIMQIFQT